MLRKLLDNEFYKTLTQLAKLEAKPTLLPDEQIKLETLNKQFKKIIDHEADKFRPYIQTTLF